MIAITEKQFFDYIKCPLRYDAQYNIGMVAANHPTISSLLGKIGNSFLLNLMNDKVLLPSQLKRKWDRACEEHKDIISPKANMAGITKLLNMYRWAEDQQLLVADMKFPYIYNLPQKQIQFHGEVTEALVPNSRDNKKYELLALDFSDKYPDQALLDTKLKLSLDWKACQLRYRDKYDLSGIHIHHVKTGKDFYTFRTHEDMVRLNKSIIAVAKAIKNKIYYPRESVMCSQCDMKMYCRAWRGTIEGDK